MKLGDAFELPTARVLATACALAYPECPWPDSQEWACLSIAPGSHATLLRHLPLTGLATNVIAFRGTDSPSDWFTDGRAYQGQFQCYPGHVHVGFALHAESLWKWVQERVRIFVAGPVWLTGHSLGGATATLLSHRLAAAGVTVAPVYTFGSPRVGNASFAAGYTQVQWRIVDSIDAVPHAPPFFWYRHVGQEVLVGQERTSPRVGGSMFEDALNWIWRLKHSVFDTFSQSLADHAIAKYEAALAQTTEASET